ncbi:MAG: FimB/Mfa2 family fimbrial subunit [Muribaculaceae bacterium]|nr:FimB/Mfa2 family fimbrial subunit [Muribaculaceae bacterium]
MGEQEYLDRQDDYSMHFILDQNNNWYKAAGVFINSWAVVPPQDM